MMKVALYLAFALITLAYSCEGPNNAASNRISTAPLSEDPTETMPGTGQQAPTNRVEPRTGTAPTNDQLPPHSSNPAGNDSTAQR